MSQNSQIGFSGMGPLPPPQPAAPLPPPPPDAVAPAPLPPPPPVPPAPMDQSSAKLATGQGPIEGLQDFSFSANPTSNAEVLPALEVEGALLKQGSTGQEVQRMQSLLRDYGGAGASQSLDGRLDKATDEAIRQFQAFTGLAVDGIAGPHTKSALEAAKLVVEARQALATGLAESKSVIADRLKQADALLRRIPVGQGGPAWAALGSLAQAVGVALPAPPGSQEENGATQQASNKQAQDARPPALATEGGAKLEQMTEAQLKHLGATNKQAFLDALRPAAEEAERKTGVPAAITLAQAALETGWGKRIISGYNIFGIKGTGSAGSITVNTHEVLKGKRVAMPDRFAKYHNFAEAMVAHSKVMLNGRYNRALQAYARNRDPHEFGRLITGIYATDPQYHQKLSSIMRQYRLV